MFTEVIFLQLAHMKGGVRELSGVSSTWILIPLRRLHSHDAITSQSFHLQILLHWEFGFNMNFGGSHSFHNIKELNI